MLLLRLQLPLRLVVVVVVVLLVPLLLLLQLVVVLLALLLRVLPVLSRGRLSLGLWGRPSDPQCGTARRSTGSGPYGRGAAGARPRPPHKGRRLGARKESGAETDKGSKPCQFEPFKLIRPGRQLPAGTSQKAI